MTDTLDETLKVVLWAYTENGRTEEDAIDMIKYAFADAGYLQHDEYGVVKTYNHYATNVMTGQEWYDRFEKEADKGDMAITHATNYEYYKEYFRVAAKAAAGLE